MDFGANRVSDRAPKKGEYRCSSVDGLSGVSNAQLIEAQLKNISSDPNRMDKNNSRALIEKEYFRD